MKKALVLMTCLCMLVSMMTGITVGAAWDLMYYPVETESVIATSWKTAIDNGKYTAEDGTQKTYDLNGVADATLRYITPGANGTAGAIELAMVPSETVADKKSDGTTVTRGPDYRPRILTNHMITLRTGNTYKISVYVKGNLSGTNDVNLWLNSGDKVTFDTDSSTPSAYRDVFRVRVTDQWQYVEKEFKVKEITDGSGNVKDSSSLTLGMRPMTNFPSGSFQVDELKVELTNKVASATNTVFTNGIGDGSVIDPYEITTVADIKKMAELVKEGYGYQTAHYILMNDIDMSGVEDFVGIATGTDTRNAFKGTFDGNYHVIKNMSITDSTNARGFFFAMYGATIKNLGFENAYIEGSAKIGVLAAAEGGSTITNCYVRKATLKQVYGGTWADNNMAAFVGCSVDMGNRGGLITDHTVFNNCYSTDITTIGYNGTEVTVGGGFKGTGYMNTMPYTTLNNCYTDCGQFATKGHGNTTLTDETKIEAGVLVVNNSYKSATPETVTASKLGDAFIENDKATYNYAMPVLAWEADRQAAAKENEIFSNGIGTGTVNKPYQLSNVADIEKLAELTAVVGTQGDPYRSASYKLMADIDMREAEDFKGLCLSDTNGKHCFTGTFDGNNHVISNMNIFKDWNTDKTYAALIQETSGATIKNLGVEDSNVEGNIVGIIVGADRGNTTLENCYLRNVSTKNNYQWHTGFAGGMVGRSYDRNNPKTTFNNCYVTNITMTCRSGNSETFTVPATSGAFKGVIVSSDVVNADLNNCYTDLPQLVGRGDTDGEDNTESNCYRNATPETVTAAKLNSEVFIDSKLAYNEGLPIFAWEKDRMDATKDNEVFTTGIGDGTAKRPFELSNAEDFATLSELMSTDEFYRKASYKLVSDIDLSSLPEFDGLTTITDARGTFTGTFDGNGHIIKNMSIVTNTGSNAKGMFYRMDHATVKNLGFEGATVSGLEVGVLAGLDNGSTIENCFVRNSTVFTTYSASDHSLAAFVGAHHSAAEPTKFKNCYSTGITALDGPNGKEVPKKVGGFKACVRFQLTSSADVENCYTDCTRLIACGFTGYPDVESDDKKVTEGTLVKKNTYVSATRSTVSATALGDAFIANRTSYNNGLPVLAWEADRLPDEVIKYTVAVSVGANGSVTKDGAAAPASFEVEADDTVTLTLVPDERYIAKAKVNGADYAVTNNQITLTVAEDTTVEVTFERIPDVTPGFAGNDTSYTWFKTEGGVPTIFTYHKLAEFNTGETGLEYGVKLWNNAKPEEKVILPARVSETETAKAVPGAMFAIKVYGEAIKADQSYTIVPYIGTVTGSEVAPDFE